ncbi:MAG: CocE/NonD family hydrolase [Phycisphaerae bacterium]
MNQQTHGRRRPRVAATPVLLLFLAGAGCAAPGTEAYVRARYEKHEYRIPMRDGVRLSTAVYAPRHAGGNLPILLFRTPYSHGPYGEDRYPATLGPNRYLAERADYIYVYQDVRGRFMSEGTFVNMRPHLDEKKQPTDIDESSDTYDTIEWLLKHVPGHNGRVGQWGISYPGFYAAAGMIDAHPALKAVSPQAPIADWWFDDFHHHGALFLPHAFNFLSVFGRPRPTLTTEWGERFDHGTPDGYRFFMDLGPLKNVNERYFHHDIAFWDDIVAHPNYDDFWQARNLLPHLNRVAPAVMTVGGWFDAEDLYGALNIYRAVEARNPDAFNVLVMGPWRHGGWARGDGDRLGNIGFGAKTSPFYQRQIETPFFDHFLKDRGDLTLPEAYMFETGTNRWRTFDHWPPESATARRLYFHAGGRLAFDTPPDDAAAYDAYVSDPAVPVPFSEDISTGMTRTYMTDDQRFAARRPDVLAYQTGVLDDDVTLAGPVEAELWVSTSGTDSDWIVKLIDVLPPDAGEFDDAHRAATAALQTRRPLGGYQMMVRSEVIRGRFRDGADRPRPFEPNTPTRVRLRLQDVLHTFRKGHRIMVQVQSTWFPLVDRNPQSFVDNVYLADESDFIKATQRVYHDAAHATRLDVGVLPAVGNRRSTEAAVAQSLPGARPATRRGV